MSISVANVLPAGWRDLIMPQGRIAFGLDPATTTKQKSNPSALAIIQEDGAAYAARVVARWKTAEPDIARAIIDEALDLPHGLRPVALCVDATSEKYFAADLRKYCAGRVRTHLVVSSETLVYQGEKMTYKLYLGNLLVNAVHDRNLILPQSDWLTKDLRQVKRAAGTFAAEVEADGSHGDCFDGIKLALYGLMSKNGPAQVSDAPVGQFGSRNTAPPDRRFPDTSDDYRHAGGLNYT